ncbi:NACHT domain-containing NTPase [Rhizobium ruizarguesonis]
MNRVPIVRKFAPIPELQQQEGLPLDDVLPGVNVGSPQTWDDLLKLFRVVILADAGAGKTFEFRAAAERLVGDGKASFFLRIERIDGVLEDAFEVGSRNAFDQWLEGSEDAWFFLDAVDEIRLTEVRSFERAIRLFAGKIRSAQHRAHIFISGRPYAWRPQIDRALVEEALPVNPVTRSAESEGDLRDIDTDDARELAVRVQQNDPEDRKTLQLYLLQPLYDDEIGMFADRAGIESSSAFLDGLTRAAMTNLARSPFDLNVLIEMWRSEGELPARLQVLQGGVRRMLSDRDVGTVLSPDRALAGARLIAIAVVLTGRSGINMPTSESPEAIIPGVLLPDWTASELEALLLSGVFGEPVYGQVRFRHREIYELLAAEWVAEQYGKVGGRDRLESNIFRTMYGEEIVAPRMRPLLPWLILFDEATRHRVIERYPEIVTEGGDAASLHSDIRRKMLGGLIAQVTDPRFGARHIDNSAIERIADRELEDRVVELLEEHHDNDQAVFLLARLVWQGRMTGCVDKLLPIGEDRSRSIYTRIVAVRAVASVGTADQLRRLWNTVLVEEGPVPRRLFAELVSNSPANHAFVGLVVDLLAGLAPYQKYETSGAAGALTAFIGRLANDGHDSQLGPLQIAIQGLDAHLQRPPFVEAHHCEISAEYQWLLGSALFAVERLALARSPIALSPPALRILAAAPVLRSWRGEDLRERTTKMKEALCEWSELNDALYWWTLETYRQNHPAERVTDDWQVTWVGHFWAFREADFERVLSWVGSRTLHDDRLVALSRAVLIYRSNGKRRQWLTRLRSSVNGDPALETALDILLHPPVSEEARRHKRAESQFRSRQKKRESTEAKNRAGWAVALKADPEQIRNPGLKPGELSPAQYYLLRMAEGDGEPEGGRARGARWQSLIEEFGLPVAEAYRDAAKCFWRHYMPQLRSDGGDTSSIPYALIFAMAGMDIEFYEQGQNLTLSESDLRKALRYAPWELNGFPRWFERVFKLNLSISIDFLWREVRWELEEKTAGETPNNLLADIVYHAPWLNKEFAQLISEWLEGNDAPNQKSLQHCRTIMVNGGISPRELAALARNKISTRSTPGNQIPIWQAILVDTDPARALREVRRWLTRKTTTDALGLGREFLVALLGGRHEVGPIIGLFQTPSFLQDLYLLMHKVVPVEEDIDRIGMGVYSPTIQDEAQEARERIVAQLEQLPGELSLEALRRLSLEHPVPRYRDYIKAIVKRRTVKDGDLLDWPLQEVAKLAISLNCRTP